MDANKYLRCTVCRITGSFETFKEHRHLEDSFPKYQCYTCSKQFVVMTMLKSHVPNCNRPIRIRNEDFVHQCQQCYGIFEGEEELTTHGHTCVITCCQCKRIFNTIASRNSHSKSCFRVKRSQKVYGKSRRMTSNNQCVKCLLPTHDNIEGVECKPTCPRCGNIFKFVQHRNRHLNTRCTDPDYFLMVCCNESQCTYVEKMKPGAELKIKQHMTSHHNLILDVVENEVHPNRVDEDTDPEVIDADNDSSADESHPNFDEDMTAHEDILAEELFIRPDLEQGINFDIPIGLDYNDDVDYNYDHINHHEVFGDGGEQSVIEFDHQTDEDVDNVDIAEEQLGGEDDDNVDIAEESLEEEDDDDSSKSAMLN